jgi:ABC-type uncharacterized transport system auxiliary subunit
VSQNFKLIPAVLALATMLPACSGGLHSDAPPEQIYVLQAARGGNTAAASVQAVLLVPRPVVQPGLDTSSIALARSDNELDYFAGSRWGESLPKVLGALAVESMIASGAFSTVLGDTRIAVRGDYELLLTVRHFEARYAAMNEAPHAQVALSCVLAGGVPRRVLGRCDAEAEELAAANRVGEIVAALERAAQRALTQAGAQAAELARASVRK